LATKLAVSTHLLYQGFAEYEMCLPFTIEKLHKTVFDLGVTNEQLKPREALMQSEKNSFVGQLSLELLMNSTIRSVCIAFTQTLCLTKSIISLAKGRFGNVRASANRCKKSLRITKLCS
jgi:hypothetical protein